MRDLNAGNKQTQFADFNGHGWIYRAVFKHDRKGNWLDKDDRKVDFNDPKKFEKAVHLSDIHLDKGMHCIDCHFEQDSHGDGHLYGEPRAAVEIDCADCHGTSRARASLKTSNTAAPEGGHDLAGLRTPFGTRRFEWVGRPADAALHGGREGGVEGLAGAGFDHARIGELQREGAAGEDDRSATA